MVPFRPKKEWLSKLKGTVTCDPLIETGLRMKLDKGAPQGMLRFAPSAKGMTFA